MELSHEQPMQWAPAYLKKFGRRALASKNLPKDYHPEVIDDSFADALLGRYYDDVFPDASMKGVERMELLEVAMAVLGDEPPEEIKRRFDHNEIVRRKGIHETFLSVAGEAGRLYRDDLGTASKPKNSMLLSERSKELWLADADYQSLDDTLVSILNRDGMTDRIQGEMRLLFGYAVIDNPKTSPGLVMQLKANAAGILRHKLASANIVNRSDASMRAKEGEILLYRIITQARAGYPTIQSMAETIELDKESRAKASYSSNVERNKMMIETFISSALDVMYPEAK